MDSFQKSNLHIDKGHYRNKLQALKAALGCVHIYFISLFGSDDIFVTTSNDRLQLLPYIQILRNLSISPAECPKSLQIESVSETFWTDTNLQIRGSGSEEYYCECV